MHIIVRNFPVKQFRPIYDTLKEPCVICQFLPLLWSKQMEILRVKTTSMGMDGSKPPNYIAVAIPWLHLKWRERPFSACLFGFLTSSSTTRLSHGRVPRLTYDNFTCCNTEAHWGVHDFCLRWSHYPDTDPTSSLVLGRFAISAAPQLLVFSLA